MSRKGCRVLSCLVRPWGSRLPRPRPGAKMGLSLELLSSPARCSPAERRGLQAAFVLGAGVL